MIMILFLHVGHVGGEAKKNIFLVVLWAPANVGEKHCVMYPEREVASQELYLISRTYFNYHIYIYEM